MTGPDTAGLAVDLTVHRGDFELRARFAAAPGEVLGLVGPNGAGKSTLLAALAGLIAAEGSVRWRDRDLLACPPPDRRTGLLFQDYLLFPHLSVLDNVAFGPRSAGQPRRTARRQAHHWLVELDLAHLADRRPMALSGGQAQRVALARALAAAPELLLLDEPLAALDAAARRAVRAELAHRLASFAGVAVLVSHDRTDIDQLADRVLVLEAGRLVQQGRPAELRARPGSDFLRTWLGSA